MEKNAGLVAYWSDIYDLQLQMGNSLSNVLREYPAQSGWIRIDKETDKADSFNPKADIAYDSGQEDKWILFPELKSTVLPNSQVNYDVTDPSKAVVICGSSYVQLQTRDGRIEPYMVDTCLEFIGLTQARNTCLKEDEMFCLRSLWFNSVSSEVTVYLDYLYEYGNTPEYSVQRVKNMFRDGEVLGDGILYETMVRCMPVSMDSEHFYENNKEFYKSQDLSSYLSFSWGDGKFSFMDGTKRMVGGNIKVNNNYQQPLTFTINGEFESAGENDRILGTKVLEPVQAEDEMGNRIFTLEGHEAKTLSLLFKSTAGEGYKSEKPFRLYLSVKDDSPDYQ